MGLMVKRRQLHSFWAKVQPGFAGRTTVTPHAPHTSFEVSLLNIVLLRQHLRIPGKSPALEASKTSDDGV
jgi:hypothetical protein